MNEREEMIEEHLKQRQRTLLDENHFTTRSAFHPDIGQISDYDNNSGGVNLQILHEL